MRTLQISITYFFFVLAATFTVLGCNNPSAAPPAVEKPKQMAAQPSERASETLTNSPEKPSSGSVTDSTLAGPTNNSQLPASIELNTPSGQSDPPQTAKVDHNDPTSYPATTLAEKTAGQLLMLAWNVESNGAEADTICQELTKLNADDRYDVVALTEVLPADFSKFRLALGEHYKYAFSKSGRNDRMQILYNENRFEKIRHFEIDKVNILQRYRAPLVVHLKERKTDSRSDESEFLVMVNHLARGKANIRQRQATMLVEWGREQTLPVVGLGDYNFDYVFSTDKGNPAFVNFMQDNVWRWVKPMELVDTCWYDDPRDPDGKDDYPGSMLDFAFVAGPAKDWNSSCRVIVRENDFPDDDKTSDHRPYEVTVQK